MAILLPLMLCLLASTSAIDQRFFNFSRRIAEFEPRGTTSYSRELSTSPMNTMTGRAAAHYRMYDIHNIVDDLPQKKHAALETLATASAAKKQVLLDGLANASAVKNELVQGLVQKKKEEIQVIVNQTASIIQKIADKKQVLFHTIEDVTKGVVTSLAQKKDTIVTAIESASAKKIRIIKELVENSRNKIEEIAENVKNMVHTAVDTKQNFLQGIVDHSKSVIASLSQKKDAAVKAITDNTKRVVQYVIDKKIDLEQDLSYKKQSIVQGIADKKIDAIKTISDKTQEFISTASLVKPLLIGQIQDILGHRREDTMNQEIVGEPTTLPIDERSVNSTQPIKSELNETVARNNQHFDGNVESTNLGNDQQTISIEQSSDEDLDMFELYKQFDDDLKRIRVYVLKNGTLPETTDPHLEMEEAFPDSP